MLQPEAIERPQDARVYGQSKVDQCVFRKPVEKHARVVVMIHVNGVLVPTHLQAAMEHFIADINKHFAIKDLGEANYLLGCHIPRNRKEWVHELNQHLCVKTMAERFGVMKATIIQPVAGSAPLSTATGPPTEPMMEEMRGIPYWEAVAEATM